MGADSITLYLEDGEGTFLRVQPENQGLCLTRKRTNIRKRSQKSCYSSPYRLLAPKTGTNIGASVREDLEKAREELQAGNNRGKSTVAG